MRQVVRLAKRRYWASIIVGTVAPGAIAALIMYIVTDGVTGWSPVVAAALGGLLTAGVLGLIGGDEPTNQPSIVQAPPFSANQPGTAQPPLPTSLTQDKVFSPRTPDELVNEVRGLTDIRRQHAIQLHLSQWLHATGHIRNVRQGVPGGEIIVSVDLTNSDVAISFSFDPSLWQARLQAANIGDTVSAIGKIRDLDSHGGYGIVWLDECELLDLNSNLPSS